MKIGPVFLDDFYSDGRGPVLQRVHWALDGQLLRAIDFVNPDEDTVKHVRFEGMQVFMFTPEEVINYLTLSPVWEQDRKAGVICLGRSRWLESFSPRHLEDCAHDADEAGPSLAHHHVYRRPDQAEGKLVAENGGGEERYLQ